jgi:hypothetical protein
VPSQECITVPRQVCRNVAVTNVVRPTAVSSSISLSDIFGTGHSVTHSVNGAVKEQYNLGNNLGNNLIGGY